MAIINFYGVIVSVGIKKESGFAVCCASRIDSKNCGIISLEGSFNGETPDFNLEPGNLVRGKANILNIWDGSILVEFIKDGFQIMPANSITDLNGNQQKYINLRKSQRQIILVGKNFYKFRLDKNIYSPEITWKEWPFGLYGLNLLSCSGGAMASLEGNAMFITKITMEKMSTPSIWQPIFNTKNSHKNDKKNLVKFTVFLLVLDNIKEHTPIFMLCMDSQEKLKRGGIYHFNNLPILQNNDTLPVGSMAECESTLYCGKGNFSPVENPDLELSAWLYDELGDMAMMPQWLWQKYFKGKIDREFLVNLMSKIQENLKQHGKSPSRKIHGWWYFWNWMCTISGSDEEKVAILAPDYRDNGPVRIVILPESIHRKDTKCFPAHASAVSVSNNPEIIEGSYMPSPSSWELIKKWVIDHEKQLKEEMLL